MTGSSVSSRPARLARNATWLMSGELFSRLVAFAVTVYLARVLGATGFGLLGAALALVEYFKLFVNAGMDVHGIRDAARTPDELGQIYARVVGLRLVLCLFASAALVAVLVFAPSGGLGREDLVLIYGLLIWVEAFSNTWVLRAVEQMRRIALGLIVQHLLMAAGILWLVRDAGADLRVVPVVHVLSMVALNVFQYRYLRRHHGRLRPALTLEALRPVLREAAVVSTGKFMRIMYYNGDVLLLAWLVGTEVAGQFLASHKIVISFLMMAMVNLLNTYPTTSRLYQTDPASAVHFHNLLHRLMLLSLLPGIVIGQWYAGPLMVLLFGEEFRDAGHILAWMLPTVPLVFLNSGLQNILLAGKYMHHVLFSGTATFLVHLSLALWWIPVYGGVGAALGCIIAESLALVMLVTIVWRITGAAPWDGRLLKTVAAGLAMVALLWMVSDWPLALQIVAAVLIYVGVALGLGSVRKDEIAAVFAFVRRTEGSR